MISSQSLGHTSTIKSEAPKITMKVLQHKNKLAQRNQHLGIPKEPLGTRFSSEWGGNSNRFGELVDLSLILKFSKDQLFWFANGGDLEIWSGSDFRVLEGKTSSPILKKGRGIYTP
jgi:hypothetical protein